MAKRKMDAPEMASRLGITVRHARRLRAEDDDRCYTDSYSTEERATPLKPDFLEEVREGIRKLGSAWMAGCWRPIFVPDEYANIPDNFKEIEAAARSYNKAVNALDGAIGLYREDDPNGGDNDGLPTIFQRAVLGMPIHVSYRKRVEAWAKKYGKTTKPDCFFGSAEDVADLDSPAATTD